MLTMQSLKPDFVTRINNKNIGSKKKSIQCSNLTRVVKTKFGGRVVWCFGKRVEKLKGKEGVNRFSGVAVKAWVQVNFELKINFQPTLAEAAILQAEKSF